MNMGDSSKGNNAGDVSIEGSSFKEKKKFVCRPYMSDNQLIRRVDKYLDEKVDQDVIDKEVMVEDLRMQYKEYGRKNKNAFRAAVFKAFNIVMQTSMNAQMRQGSSSELDVSSESENNLYDDSYIDDDDIYINQIKPTSAACSRRSNGAVSYIQSVKKMTNCLKNSSHELISISSDEEDKEPRPVKISANVVENKVESRNTPGVQIVTTSDLKRPIILSSNGKPSPLNVSLLQNRRTDPERAQVVGVDLEVSNNNNSARKRKSTLDIQGAVIKKPKIDSVLIPKKKFQDFGGKREILESVSQIIMHMKHPEIYRKLGASPPRGFLLHGPPGSGKTLLANAIAGELEVPLVKVASPELVAGVSGESELRIRELFEQAIALAPCVLFMDEVDAITPRRDTAHKDMERRIVAQLLASLDDLNNREGCDGVLVIGATNRPDSLDPALRRAGRFDREISLGIPDRDARESILRIICSGLRIGPAIRLADLAALTPGFVGADLKALTSEAAIASVNRIIYKNKLGKKTSSDRGAKPAEITNRSTAETEPVPMEVDTVVANGTKSDEDKSKADSASTSKEAGTEEEQNSEKSTGESDKKTENEKENSKPQESETSGKAAEEMPKSISQPSDSDVMILSTESGLVTIEGTKTEVSLLHLDSSPLTAQELEDLYIEMEDFLVALKTVQPSAKREGFATVPDVTWNDIGSLSNIRDQLQMSIMMPVKYPEEFAKLGVTSPTGILLCGPPGCGKTLLAKAVANEANINFISVKGPELLNMYVGESERAVRQCFQRARNSQPCVIFFDEIDALCPKRSESVEGSASARVVNQLLTEMDGVEDRHGVFLMAATNRPDMVDTAVMRPGRFDKILYVGLPQPQDRVDILKALTKNGTKPRLGSDVDLSEVAHCEDCNGYTGADLSALIKEASIMSLTEYIDSRCVGDLVVKSKHLHDALKKIRPSVSDKDRTMYEKMRLHYAVPGHAKEKK